MILLNPEVNIVPGAPGRLELVAGGATGVVGAGHAVVRLENDTDQQNSFVVHVASEAPLWQDAWYTMEALGTPNAVHPDQYGAQKRSVTVFVEAHQTRDVMVRFNVPRTPEARAGVYPFQIVVNTRILAPGVPPGEGRIRRLDAKAIVRPFYQWSVSLAPPARRVGIFRRSAGYEAQIVNEGNDWLYCALSFGDQQNLLAQTPTSKVAVPPPPAGASSMARSVPVRATAKMRQFRGERTPLSLALQASRIEAPSVPELEGDVTAGVPSANLTRGVVEEPTQEHKAPEQAQLVYCPLIPTSWSGCFGQMVQNAKKLALTLVGLILLYTMYCYAVDRFIRHDLAVTINQPRRDPGSRGKEQFIPLSGRYLDGGRLVFYEDKGDNKQGEELDSIPLSPKNVELVTLGQERQSYKVPVDLKAHKALNDKSVRVGFQRAAMLRLWKNPIIPESWAGKTEMIFGAPSVSPAVKMARTTYSPGGEIRLEIQASADNCPRVRGVSVGGDPVKQFTQAGTNVSFACPANAKNNDTVEVDYEGGGRASSPPITVEAPPVPPPGPMSLKAAGPVKPGATVQLAGGSNLGRGGRIWLRGLTVVEANVVSWTPPTFMAPPAGEYVVSIQREGDPAPFPVNGKLVVKDGGGKPVVGGGKPVVGGGKPVIGTGGPVTGGDPIDAYIQHYSGDQRSAEYMAATAYKTMAAAFNQDRANAGRRAEFAAAWQTAQRALGKEPSGDALVLAETANAIGMALYDLNHAPPKYEQDWKDSLRRAMNQPMTPVKKAVDPYLWRYGFMAFIEGDWTQGRAYLRDTYRKAGLSDAESKAGLDRLIQRFRR